MRIVYTYTDEAPALATMSLLPIVRAFASLAGMELELADISLAGRLLAQFPERLGDRAVPDALTQLGKLAQTPEANIIKLPNISASIPQLRAAIAELQGQGLPVPDFPAEPQDAEQREVRRRYDRVLGSAVNPVLRQGNSDRRAPASVKRYARSHPHPMADWSPDSRSRVATMAAGDFRDTERSVTVASPGEVRIEHVSADGSVTPLRAPVPVQAGEVLDAAVMRAADLQRFLKEQVDAARAQDLLFSVHVKATMMKVSDPIIFGHAVRAFFSELFERHGAALQAAGLSPDDGLGSLLAGLERLSPEQRDDARAAIDASLARGAGVAMVDSDRGITTLHVPSDVIIDASMPAAIRAGGRMYDREGRLRDTLFVIPDHSYAALYAETIEDCRRNGAFDPKTMGTTPNVGLMAQAAEEYGSHDKTFRIAEGGVVRVVDGAGRALFEHEVREGDIWRMCQTKDAAIRDWVGLAIARARATGWPAVFWLDEDRPHDAQLLVKVREELERRDADGLALSVMPVAEATRYTLSRARAGQDTISVTGNVLRDYLTDLFPILELGTSAKMLSIVPLMSGGSMFETGAGGSAPRHVQQFLAENHLRWDSLGEFLALAASFETFAERTANRAAGLLGDALDRATGAVLEHGRSPSRRVGELDNRGSHFYLALYWARELAEQSEDPALARRVRPLAERLERDEQRIVAELAAVQGSAVDIGGYYRPDERLAQAAMRPSETFNAAIDSLRAGLSEPAGRP
ncbi:MAG TPA: NADP-dependent isocitrate dehydrogenase [Solirubrobacteraceae bacterium]|nr:NADP-dependent isocitrate dehydrogenase [Solirubrobacteraceae bacterium]